MELGQKVNTSTLNLIKGLSSGDIAILWQNYNSSVRRTAANSLHIHALSKMHDAGAAQLGIIFNYMCSVSALSQLFAKGEQVQSHALLMMAYGDKSKDT